MCLDWVGIGGKEGAVESGLGSTQTEKGTKIGYTTGSNILLQMFSNDGRFSVRRVVFSHVAVISFSSRQHTPPKFCFSLTV